jgi:hypothetical protein
VEHVDVFGGYAAKNIYMFQVPERSSGLCKILLANPCQVDLVAGFARS